MDYRFYHNLRKQRNDRDFGELITQETDAAERKTIDLFVRRSGGPCCSHTSNVLIRNKENGVPDLDLIDSQRMNRRFLYRQRIRQELRETLSSGISRPVEEFSKSRKEDGRDGRVRVVEVSTSSGSFLRPLQRLYPLEVSGTDISDLPEQIKETLKDRV
ncbi:DUF5641 domain-containing protein [Trichonephila clavipes]|nr:DUF5641 domain-containing protein [Trichonephila clavipes]